MNRLMKDLAVDRAKNPEGALLDRWDPEEEHEDEEDDINIIDRSECFFDHDQPVPYGCGPPTVALTIL